MTRPKLTKQRGKLLQQYNKARKELTDSITSGDENDLPAPLELSNTKRDTWKSVSMSQIAEKDAEIARNTALITELESRVSRLEADLLQFHIEHQHLVESLTEQRNNLEAQNCSLLTETRSLGQSLGQHKRKAENTFGTELVRKQKQIKRLENEHNGKAAAIAGLADTIDQQAVSIEDLQASLAAAEETAASFQSQLRERQSLLTGVWQELYGVLKRHKWAAKRLKEVERVYKGLRTWNPKEGNTYSPSARQLARKLISCGCAEGKISLAVRSCAEAFGIRIPGVFMSRRTVARARDEGGKYGKLQLAQEIMNCKGFIESSDGTTHCGVTVESHFVSLYAPTYAPSVDNADTSTWTPQNRFFDLAPALDHTAERQFEGTKEAVSRIADVYSRSLWQLQNNVPWIQDGEMKDHAADGKKEFDISASHKEDIVMRDLGQDLVLEGDSQALFSRILRALAQVTDVKRAAAGNITVLELGSVSADERVRLTALCIQRQIGEMHFTSLPFEEQRKLLLHLFGGCCSRKDLNVVRKGYTFIQALYATDSSLQPPVLLANKANDMIITVAAENAESNTAAAQAAVEASSRGAIKLLQLLGSLLWHQDGKRGYQDKCVLFMKERRLELYNLDEPGKFPDVSNTRFGAYTYATAEVICFHVLILELIDEIIDGKVQSGQPNHVEKNIQKGLDCAATMTEIAALALYGVSVSWPYMALVHGKKDKPVNLLSLTDLHRKLPLFCTHVADYSEILLDPKTPLNQLTINGLPFRDHLILPTILSLARELPNLSVIVSAMFRGAAEGWIHFTPEFAVDGPFDQLTPEEKARIFIPATNDHNEGMLGLYRVHMRYHSNSTALSFSNQARAEQNNTEAFIQKHGSSKAIAQFVMREVRRDGASGRAAKFRKDFLALQREKVKKARRRRMKTVEKKRVAQERLLATNLELNIDKIQRMTSPQLKSQLQAYCDKLKDEILGKMKWKDMQTVDIRRGLVLAARERELARRETTEQAADIAPALPQTVNEVIVEEFGYAPEEDGTWKNTFDWEESTATSGIDQLTYAHPHYQGSGVIYGTDPGLIGLARPHLACQAQSGLSASQAPIKVDFCLPTQFLSIPCTSYIEERSTQDP
ncbi:hypothetical protein DFH08DRAFT_815166 [Mycena albidolilacea]|uniref:Uncharacterized protein n=1 Tax=Mycena albidolilacea TaxID=1033008 RepID=A0AAD6ZNE3_9AGAR|nr:hypothetical protein DFH08DRAFT_815166 [Mycena albidolilacea]